MIRAPEKQGLYDPRNEHDSCGVGFVANISGEKSNAIIARRPAHARQPRSPRRAGADPLVGDGAGCLIQIPDELLRDWAHAERRHPAPAGRLRRRHVLPPAGCAKPRRGDSAARALHRDRGADPARLARCSDGPDRSRRSGPRVAACDPAGDRCPRPAHRRPGRVRAQDPDDPQADAEPALASSPRSATSPTSRISTFRHSPAGPSSTKGCCSRRRSAPSIATSRTRERSPRSRWSTSASRPTPSRAGSSRTPIASSPTTARSIPFAAT